MCRAFHSYRSRLSPCNRLAPFLLELLPFVSRLLGFTGPAPPPSQDKSIHSLQNHSVLSYGMSTNKTFIIPALH